MTGARYLSPPLSPFSSLLSVFSPTHLLALPQLSSQLLSFGLLSEPFSLLRLFFSREPRSNSSFKFLLKYHPLREAGPDPSVDGGTLSPPPSAPLIPITLPYLFSTSTCYLSTTILFIFLPHISLPPIFLFYSWPPPLECTFHMGRDLHLFTGCTGWLFQ